MKHLLTFFNVFHRPLRSNAVSCGKLRTTKTLLVASLVWMMGMSAWADNFSPTADYSVRINSTKDGYSWFKNSDGEFELKQQANIFGLQTYTVTNLAAAKKITLVLKGQSDKGTDASAIWVFTKNDWSTSTPGSDMEAAFSATTGVSHGSTGTTSSTYLMINKTSNRSTTDDVQTCNFEITGDKLSKLKSVASGNTFTLLITNAVSDVEGNSETQRKYYSSSNTTEAYRPYVAVEYNPVVLETNSTITTYTTLNGAFDDIATAGTGIISLYDNATITSRCNTEAKTISVIPTKNVTISSELYSSIWILNNNSSGNLTIGSDDYQITIDGGNLINSANHIETSGNSTTTLNNVKFLNCKCSKVTDSSNQGGLINNKGGGMLYLKNCAFEGCTASTTGDNSGMVFVGTNNVYIQGNISFTDCMGNGFFEQEQYLRVSDMTEPATPISIYRKNAALGSVILSSTNNYVNKTSWFTISNDGFGLAYQSNNADHVLTEAYTLNVSNAGAATLVLPYTATIPSGVSAYTLTHIDGSSTVNATEVEETTLAANTPVLINAEEGNYKFVNTAIVNAETTGSVPVTFGALTGVYADQTFGSDITSYDNIYILNNGASGVGFYKAASGKNVGANRAYLTANGVSSAGALRIVFGEEEVTGINAVQDTEVESQSYYDLSGKRVSKPTKGLYIINGKKVIIK